MESQRLKLCIIIRGIPGSGKSTLGSCLLNAYESANIPCRQIESDDYFIGPTGSYQFDPKKIGAAINYVELSAAKFFSENTHGVLILSNCYTKRNQFELFRRLASQHGFDMQVISVESSFLSVHNVPAGVVATMRAQFER